jgi:hypothetical protein
MVTPLTETESGSWKLVSVHRPTRHGSPIARGLGLGEGAIPVPVPPPHATTVATHATHKVRAIGGQPRVARSRRADRFARYRSVPDTLHALRNLTGWRVPSPRTVAERGWFSTRGSSGQPGLQFFSSENYCRTTAVIQWACHVATAAGRISVQKLVGGEGFEPSASQSRNLGGLVHRERFRGF